MDGAFKETSASIRAEFVQNVFPDAYPGTEVLPATESGQPTDKEIVAKCRKPSSFSHEYLVLCRSLGGNASKSIPLLQCMRCISEARMVALHTRQVFGELGSENELDLTKVQPEKACIKSLARLNGHLGTITSHGVEKANDVTGGSDPDSQADKVHVVETTANMIKFFKAHVEKLVARWIGLECN